jgi:hypothetical protein
VSLRTIGLANIRYRIRPWTPASKLEAALAVCGLIVGFAGCFWWGPIYIEAMRPTSGRVNDFFQDWGSARNFLIGLPVYTHHTTSIPRHLGVPRGSRTDIDYNAHPPTSVLLVLPLAQLDYPDAVLAWNVISLVAFLFSLGIVAVLLPVPRSFFFPVLALLTFCHPLYGNLYYCQLTLILILLVTITWALERAGWSGTAAAVIGTAAAIKLFPGYLAIYFAAKGRLRPLLVVALSFTVLTAVTAAILGFDAYRDYVQVVLPAQTRFQSLGYNHAAAGLWHKFFDPAGENGLVIPLWSCPALAQGGTLASDLVITFIVAVMARQARTTAEHDVVFASVITAMVLVSPVSWDTSLLLLLVPVAVMARHARGQFRMQFGLLAIGILIWLPQQALTNLALGRPFVRPVSWLFMLGAPSLKSYALLGLFALEVAAFRTARTASREVDGSATGALRGGLGFTATPSYND